MSHDDLMLVGSIAYDTAEEVFRAMSAAIGDRLAFMPDGEIGERISWINHLAYRVYHGHPDIETLDRPLDQDGVEAWKAGHTPNWSFKVKPGVTRVRFGEPGWRLGYARGAIESYFVFKTLKREGVIPAHVRFQVSIPLTGSSVRLYFKDPEDYPKIEPAITEALAAEVRNICAHIPPEELAIQWDCAIEDTVIEGALAKAGGKLTEAVDHVAEGLFLPAAAVNADIPEAALVGYHACYGTATGWPVREPQDLTGVVLLLNHAVKHTGRRVDFVHMPTVRAEGPEYFAPLADLDPGGARVYMGLIHALHPEGGMRNQMEWIARHIPDFGIAAPCGFGRGPGKMSSQSGLATANAYMDGIIADHQKAAALLDELRAGAA
jgi:hypothetical protein